MGVITLCFINISFHISAPKLTKRQAKLKAAMENRKKKQEEAKAKKKEQEEMKKKQKEDEEEEKKKKKKEEEEEKKKKKKEKEDNTKAQGDKASDPKTGTSKDNPKPDNTKADAAARDTQDSPYSLPTRTRSRMRKYDETSKQTKSTAPDAPKIAGYTAQGYIRKVGNYSEYETIKFDPNNDPPQLEPWMTRVVEVNDDTKVAIANDGNQTINLAIRKVAPLSNEFLQWIAKAAYYTAQTQRDNSASVEIKMYLAPNKNIIDRAINIHIKDKPYLAFTFKYLCICREPVTLAEEASDMVKCIGRGCNMAYHQRCIDKRKIGQPGGGIVCAACAVSPKGIKWANNSCSTDNSLFYTAVLARNSTTFLPYLEDNFQYDASTMAFVKSIKNILKGKPAEAKRDWWTHIVNNKDHQYCGNVDELSKKPKQWDLFGPENEMVWRYMNASMQFYRHQECTNKQCPNKEFYKQPMIQNSLTLEQDTNYKNIFDHIHKKKLVSGCSGKDGQECTGKVFHGPLQVPEIPPWCLRFENLHVGHSPIEIMNNFPRSIEIGKATYRLRYFSMNIDRYHYKSAILYKQEWLTFDDMRAQRQARILSNGDVTNGTPDSVMYILEDLLPKMQNKK